MKYNFREAKNTMVITTKKIIKGENRILLVSHDEDDGMWEFLDGTEIREEDAAIVSLHEIVTLDSSVNDISYLPLGSIAYRNNITDSWIIEKKGEPEKCRG